MKFSIIGFIPTLLLLIPVIAACFKTPADKPELEDENIIVFIAKCLVCLKPWSLKCRL
jgi:hypothetical protein